MTVAAESISRPVATGKRAERSVKALVFQLLLLLSLLVGILTLIVLVTDVISNGASRIKPEFFTNLNSRFADRAGIKASLIGSLWLMGLTGIIAFPIGLGAAVYLEEFAPKNRFTRFIEVNVANLAAVPSIIYGLLGLAIFVRFMHLGRSVLAGSLILVLLILPVIIVSGREALRAVPPSIRQGALAVGATEWQTVWHQTLPAALPGTLTGVILGLSRAIGETAPLITLGALTFVTFVPTSPLDRFSALPIQIYAWVSKPQAAFREEVAAAAIIVLLALLLAMNAVAIIMRNRYEKRW